MKEEDVHKALLEKLPGLASDTDALDYFKSLIMDNGLLDESSIVETLAPFLESYGLANDSTEAESVCGDLCKRLRDLSGLGDKNKLDKAAPIDDAPKLLDKAVGLSKSQLSEAEQAMADTMWGFDKIRMKRNEQFEAIDAISAKDERRAAKEQKKWMEELDATFAEVEEDENQISSMTLPDLTGTSRERDIHVSNFTMTFGGKILLECAHLRLVYGRRYGLIGVNGVGKTTLLKHMAAFDIEGFPRHHRVLHVKQEVKSSEMSVLQVVLEADVERTSLQKREKDLLEKQQTSGDEPGLLQGIMDELSEVHERLKFIGADTAESRAAAILSGLQFSESMQHATTNSLSGGWRMRVALAGALFIEPDLLMLDEPTNHLDLEAVLWLQNYLQTYPHTVLLVSHDRAFLNEVCTDMILFKNLKLTYFKGNYDAYEANDREMKLVQQRQHEAQMVKVQHMQEFVDKFRYNAKRASLVQSRIKAIEREVVVEAVEEDNAFTFSFPDCGSLGRPVIEIEGVTFGYAGPKAPPLFADVHLGVGQTSRIALVGPNGSGKSTLLNLIQGKINPTDGFIHVNQQLRLGVFTQHHLDSFDLRLSPLENMMLRWPLAAEADLRAHLGRYEMSGNDTLKPMKFISGGQKSRVSFACLTYQKPHVVILDEPTNHLDMGAIEALANALKAFTGGVLVISHDQHFITQVCNEIWVVADQKIEIFKGEFDDYKKAALRRIAAGCYNEKKK